MTLSLLETHVQQWIPCADDVPKILRWTTKAAKFESLEKNLSLWRSAN